MPGTAIVAGVGPGIGESCVRRFAAAGFDVAAVARSNDYLEDLAAAVDAPGAVVPVAADLATPEAVRDCVTTIDERLGSVELLAYNAAVAQGATPFLETDRADLERVWAVDVGGLFSLCQAVLPMMVDGDGGTVVVTGSTAGTTGFEGLVPQSARGAQRNLALSLAREFAADGVHVAYAVVDGYVDRPAHRERNPDRPDDRWIDPDAVAETYLTLHGQPASGWTFQVDLRPAGGDLEAH